MESPKLSRRSFLKTSGVVSAGFLTMQRVTRAIDVKQPVPISSAYGPLMKDPAGVLDLPQGFAYRLLSRVGRSMSDGLITPGLHDGMAAFPGPRGRVVLICNHETNPDQGIASPYGIQNQLLDKVPKQSFYDW